MPSEYNEMAWSTCWYDVVYKIKLKSNELSTNHMQIFNSIAEVAAGLFGSDKDKKQPIKINDLSPDEAVSQLNDFFRQAGGG